MEYQPTPEPGRGRSWGRIIGAIIVAAILAIVFAMLVLPSMSSITGYFSGTGGSTSTIEVNPEGTVSNSSGSGTTLEISYPSNYNQLANFSLTLINQDRASAGLTPVTLSPIPSAQEHADSMLQNNYFSHWDTQGYKPYMRYSILNGTGFVEENVRTNRPPCQLLSRQQKRSLRLVHWSGR